MNGRALDWAGVVLVCAGAALAGFLEALLVPLYVGTVIVPVSVLAAVAGNVLFPLLSRTLVPRTGAAALPVLVWLVVILAFGTVSRPEGDVILPGAPTGAELVTYGVLLGGAAAGVTAIVLSTPAGRGRGRVSR